VKTEEVKKLYSERTELYQWLFLKVLRGANAIESFLTHEKYLHSEMKVLDAGCGTGLVTRILYKQALNQEKKNITFNGFDLTPAMLSVFQKWIDKKGAKSIEIKKADVLSLKLLRQSWKEYDLIVSSAMLEYIPRSQMPLAIKNLKKLLNPKGKIVIFITGKSKVVKWLVGKWWKANRYSKKELEKILKGLQFSKISFKKFPLRYFYMNFWGVIVEAQS
jgi:cyclopropane fatty-acyl-phospholipid synthase-like methyltransferase